MHTLIESLESRIAPAAVFVTYTDGDGDKVKVTVSKGPLDLSHLTLSNVTSGDLLALNLTDVEFAGADVTFSVVKKAGGDGRANVGTINATGIDLNNVIVRGDLSRFIGGDSNSATPALAKLQATSLGEKKLSAVQTSTVGGIGTLLIKGNVRDASVYTHGSNIALVDTNAHIGTVRIGGSLIGGSGLESGNIHAEGGFDSVRIGRDILGGTGDFSGRIESDNGIGTLRVGRDVLGGAGEFSGTIGGDVGLGVTKIGRDLAAGTGKSSGAIRINASIDDVRIGRDLVGGSNPESGIIWAKDGDLGRIFIGRNVIGGNATGSTNLDKSGAIIAHDSIESVRIGGSLTAGTDMSSGTIKNSGVVLAGKHLGPVSIGGSVVGNETNRAVISGVALTTEPLAGSDFGIDRLTVGGRVAYANILAGFNLNGVADNADASIGPVRVGGSWMASNLVAGAQDSGTAGFGIGDTLQTIDNNPALVARIASITIGGKVLSSPTGVSGFVSQQIDLLKIAGKKASLHSGPSNDPSTLLAGTTNVYVEEVS